MTFSAERSRSPSSAYSVVVLPAPVGPQTTTRPSGRSTIRRSAASVSGGWASASRARGARRRSSTRSTTFSPVASGKVERRKSTRAPCTRRENRPSWGRRVSAMSAPASTLSRTTIASRWPRSRAAHFREHAVEAVAHPHEALLGREMDVRGAARDRVREESVDEPRDAVRAAAGGEHVVEGEREAVAAIERPRHAARRGHAPVDSESGRQRSPHGHRAGADRAHPRSRAPASCRPDRARSARPGAVAPPRPPAGRRRARPARSPPRRDRSRAPRPSACRAWPRRRSRCRSAAPRAPASRPRARARRRHAARHRADLPRRERPSNGAMSLGAAASPPVSPMPVPARPPTPLIDPPPRAPRPTRAGPRAVRRPSRSA